MSADEGYSAFVNWRCQLVLLPPAQMAAKRKAWIADFRARARRWLQKEIVMNASDCPYTRELDDAVMTNFDHSIDRAVEARLRVEEAYGRYPGWNFVGRVWWERAAEKWKCEVWTYGLPRKVIDADDLDVLMHAVSDAYGSE